MKSGLHEFSQSRVVVASLVFFTKHCIRYDCCVSTDFYVIFVMFWSQDMHAWASKSPAHLFPWWPCIHHRAAGNHAPASLCCQGDGHAGNEQTTVTGYTKLDKIAVKVLQNFSRQYYVSIEHIWGRSYKQEKIVHLEYIKCHKYNAELKNVLWWLLNSLLHNL